MGTFHVGVVCSQKLLFSRGSGKKEMSQGSFLVRKRPCRQGRVAFQAWPPLLSPRLGQEGK